MSPEDVDILTYYYEFPTNLGEKLSEDILRIMKKYKHPDYDEFRYFTLIKMNDIKGNFDRFFTFGYTKLVKWLVETDRCKISRENLNSVILWNHLELIEYCQEKISI